MEDEVMNVPFACQSRSTAFTRTSNRVGSAMITMLILATAACVVVGSLLYLSSSETRLSRMALDQQKALVVAEAGVDYGVMQMHNLLSTYRLDPQVSQSDLLDSINMLASPPTLPGPYVYTTSTGSLFSISVDTPIVSGVLTQGNFIGNNGYYQAFTVTCGASNTVSHLTTKVQEHLQAFALYVVSFGAFYQNTLEIQPGGTMTFKGPVHCNADIYLGGPLTFYDKITTAGGVYVKNLKDGTTAAEPIIQDTHSNLVSMWLSGSKTVETSYLDSSNVNWSAQSLSKWQGQILTAAQGVGPINPPIDSLSSPHAIIERSTPTTSLLYNATTEAAKFANTAALRIYVKTNRTIVVTDIFFNTIIRSALLGTTNTITFTNQVVLLTNGILAVKNGGYSRCTNLFAKDSNGAYSMSKTGIVGIGQNFYDERQMTNMAPVDLYLDILLLYFPDLYQPSCYTTTQGQSAIYITSDPPTNSLGKVDSMPCVRLRNGSNLLTPITVASDLPIYIEGNFNSTNKYGLSQQPACAAGDAVTMLSTVWQDASSTNSTRTAASTTYKLVIMAGDTTTTPGVSTSYSGGLENELRFLEDWSSVTVTFRGSIINLWNSQMATGAWGQPNNVKGGFIYGVPGTRDWGYDTIYKVSNPPDIPMVYGMEEILWLRGN
jgi:hypothetical protein